MSHLLLFSLFFPLKKGDLVKIQVASLTLRFYERDGWTKAKIRKLLVDKKMEIIYRNDVMFPELTYYAVYENSGYKVFKKSEIMKHKFVDKNKFGGIDWYIKEGVSNG